MKSDPAEEPLVTYPDAPESLIALWMVRRKRIFMGRNDSLPPADVALRPFLETRIPENLPKPKREGTLHGMKLEAIRAELGGRPELAALNAILISHLRKQSYPRHVPQLWRRIWTEHGAELAPHLPGRWLISSVITFGDHGETEAQRRIGLAMNVFFSLMKLYEYERLYSGLSGDTAFSRRNPAQHRLPLDIPSFALMKAGLDINLMAQLWSEAREEPVAGALACYLLDRLNADPRNLFRRIGLMRAVRQLKRFDDVWRK